MAKVLYENFYRRGSGCNKKTNRWSPPSLTAVLKDAVKHGHGVLKTTHVPISDMQRGIKVDKHKDFDAKVTEPFEKTLSNERLYQSREWDPVAGRWKEDFPVPAAEYDAHKDSYIMPEPKVEMLKAEGEELSKTATEQAIDEIPPDQLDHPNYYTETGIPSGIEAWDHYELAMTPEEFQGAMKNNLYKYIFRAGHKGSETAIKDLKKAINYLKRWISYLEGHRIVWMRGTKHDSKV